MEQFENNNDLLPDGQEEMYQISSEGRRNSLWLLIEVVVAILMPVLTIINLIISSLGPNYDIIFRGGIMIYLLSVIYGIFAFRNVKVLRGSCDPIERERAKNRLEFFVFLSWLILFLSLSIRIILL